ncbi:hypothetical protein KSB_91830 [Ktedonobacter robiniae]|uniref:Recombinase family protein n=1 Tax=Ktedonobacter robiniae TaxID=2778365 RepID=A0ABQ3V713_9CHLR|nr:recombinase family protein [Ktedonobacter robiniae]GHO60708.1 hypothetical protein KSB_91830 [Ktedonobacter robiniae]
MTIVQVGLYARVSSEQQSEARTIESQLAALRAAIAAQGCVLLPELEFVDNGYSGATLIRPALERLRDIAAAGGIDRLYVLCPDRLARNYAHQVLLLEEFLRAGVDVVFLNREVGQTPEDQLLLQVQGMIAEYERAKILERSRRGKRHAAQMGRVSVLSCAPYGYRYVSVWDGAGEARFEIVLEEARVVRLIFQWVGRDRCSIGEVQRRLNAAKERTRTGKTIWDRATIWGILKNPAYKGEAAFGKTAVEPLRPRLRAQRGRSLQPKKAYSVHDVPSDQWFHIPVPPLVDAALFDAVADQLQENRKRARVSERGARYLLQGLIVCGCCGYARLLASPSVQVRANTILVSTPIIDASVQMPIDLGVSGSAGTNKCERIWWMKRSGKKSAVSLSIQSGWSRSIDGACASTRKHLMSALRWRRRWGVYTEGLLA